MGLTIVTAHGRGSTGFRLIHCCLPGHERMTSDDSKRFMACGKRYEQRRASGKVGWANEDSYLLLQRHLDDILSSSSFPSSIRFLELGCGNGNITLHMAGRGHDAYGIDIVPQAIDWAQDQAKQQDMTAHFEVGSVMTLAPYADDFFDLVFDANCLFMIINEHDRKECVANVSRVLKEDAFFYAKAHLVNETVNTRIQVDTQAWFDPKGRYSTVQGQPMYYYSREPEFLNLIEGSGLRIVRQVKEPRPDDYPVYCTGDMWVLAKKEGTACQQDASADPEKHRDR